MQSRRIAKGNVFVRFADFDELPTDGQQPELRGEGRDCLEPVRRRGNPDTPPRAMRFGSFRGRRIEQAAREVARSGHHAERDKFLAGMW